MSSSAPPSRPEWAPYLLHIVQEHATFRIPELYACARVYGFDIRIPAAEGRWDAEEVGRPGLVAWLRNEGDARRIAERCVLVKSVSELLAQGSTHEELANNLRPQAHLWARDMEKRFAFEVDAVNYKMRSKRIGPLVENLAFMALRGQVDMKDPEVTYLILEEYDIIHGAEAHRNSAAREGHFRTVYMSRLVAWGSARNLINKFDVKGRSFYGNTSMEAEMSLLMANQALAAPGKLVYDPFAGTGSLLYTAMHFGAMTFGSDIDGRQMRGKDSTGPGVYRAAQQYALRDQLIDCVTFDVTANPWRRGGLLDAIVTDPPYGVRAGAKRLGRKELKGKQSQEPMLMPDGKWFHQLPQYVPPSRPYEMAQLCYDLVLFARYMLVPGGRLVFFLPTFPEEFEEYDVPTVEGMTEIKYGTGSSQDFNKWSRKLITIEKTTDKEYPPPDFQPNEEFLKTQPGHHDFARKFRELAPPLRTPSGRACPAAQAQVVDTKAAESKVAMLEVPEGWHTATLQIPYATAEHALIVQRALSVDRELNASHVHRQVIADEGVLNVQYAAATVRLLRLATNGFLDNCKLVTRTLHEFAPK